MKKTEELACAGTELSERQLSFLRSHLDNRMYLLVRRIEGGLMGWLSKQWHAVAAPKSSLAVLAKIQLGPRHNIALLEAEGTRLLIATSSEGAAAFYPLSENVVTAATEGNVCPSCAQPHALGAGWLAQRSNYSAPGARASSKGTVLPRPVDSKPHLDGQDRRQSTSRAAAHTACARVRAGMGRISW